MCQSKDEIMKDHPIVQELDEYLSANNLPPTEKLLLRLAKHNYIHTVQIKQDIEPMQKSPSLIHLFKTKPLSTLVTSTGILFGFYVAFHVVEVLVGFDVLLLKLLP